MPDPANISKQPAKAQARPAVNEAAMQTSWAREDEDVRLMLAFQAGDESAFPKLVERNQAKVHAVVYRFLGDAGDVEDLAQEVFLRVFRTAWRYSPTAKFSTWLYRIAANLSLNAIRSRSKAKMSQLEMPDSGDGEGFFREVQDHDGPSPQDRLDKDELRERIAHAINDLPDNQRMAIVLNKYEQMSYEDIAAVLDCSVMAVKSLLSRARGNLRQSLERYLRP
jgi:RNA polymerase sigma-70 factor (ECF subfamily)